MLSNACEVFVKHYTVDNELIKEGHSIVIARTGREREGRYGLRVSKDFEFFKTAEPIPPAFDVSSIMNAYFGFSLLTSRLGRTFSRW